MTTKRLRAVMRALRKDAPTDLPVVVVRRPLRAKKIAGKKTIECGYAYRRPRCYVILVNSKLSSVEQEETLVHEYAHALAYPLQSERGSMLHDRIWGAAYARAWRAYEPA